MPYASRLMEDSGLRFGGARAARAPAVSGGSTRAPAPALESDGTITVAQPTAIVPTSAVREGAAPAMNLDSHGQNDAFDAPAVAGESRPAAGQPEGKPELNLRAPELTPSAANEGASAHRQVTGLELSDAGETHEELVLRTLAIVREWTSAAPWEVSETAPEPSSAGMEVLGLETHGDRPGEVVIRTDAPHALPERGAFPERERSAPLQEPEVVNLNVSVGSIELTLEAPETPRPAPSAAPAAPAGPAAPDAEARLRRHYVRPSLGGW